MSKQQKFKLLLFINLFFLPVKIQSLTLKKLALNTLIISNNLNQPTTITLDVTQQCSICHDPRTTQKSFVFNAQEKKELIFDNCLINDIKQKDQSAYFFITRTLDKQKKTETTYPFKHTFSLVRKNNSYKPKKTLNFIEFDFDTMMDITLNEQANNKSNNFYDHFVHNTIPKPLTYFLPQDISQSQMILNFKNLYNKKSPSKMAPAVKTKIPFIIHQIWFGITGDKPHLYKQWEKGFKKLLG